MRVMSDTGIFAVSGTFVVFRTVSSPLAEAHPTEVVPTSITLHVVTSAIFFYAYLTSRTILKVVKNTILKTDIKLYNIHIAVDTLYGVYFGVSTDVIGSLGIVGALCKPTFN